MIGKPLKLLLLVLLNIFTSVTYSQIPKEEVSSLFTMKTMIYKTIGSTELKVYIYQPAGLKNNEKRPAIIFFFGGGFDGGKVTQFVPQCKYLAERGLVTMVADYRVKSRHDVTPFECVADAKSAIRWLRIFADKLGIDTNRIVASGGSSGGHIAVCTALIKGLDEENEDLSVSSVPDALVLFNPPLNMVESIKNPKTLFKEKSDRVKEISPVHHISAGAPPTILFHGTKDSSVHFRQAVIFCDEMKKYGNRCELVPFEGKEHGFFNYNGGENPDFYNTMENTVKFLISLGYLKDNNTRNISFSQTELAGFQTRELFKTPEARQGVAVDANYFYTVNSTGIGKYNKKTGSLVVTWKDTTGKIVHLDGGVVIKDKLFCAHSNYPGIPMTSSIEIFFTKDLKHTGSHSFGIKYGSCTWADFWNDSWWICFAHYDQFRKDIGKGTESTVVVRFDEDWNEKGSWTFPQNVISEIRPMSVSGGSWGTDGKLYVTGHDSARVYILKLPQSGSVLEYLQSVKIDSHGQGIAWDRSEKDMLYGIIRKDNSVVVSELVPGNQ